MNILADETQDLQFDGSVFVPAVDGNDAPVFTIKAVDYFNAISAQDKGEHVETARVAIAVGLVAIDGDKAKAKSFADNPAASLGTPIFNAIWGLTWGNSRAPAASE